MKTFNRLQKLLVSSLAIIGFLFSVNLTFAQTSEADGLFVRACEKSYGVNNVSINAKEGFRLFEQAMKAGSLEAQAEAANIYFIGLGAPCDKNKAFQLAQKPAEKGNPLAASVLGRCYADGSGGAEKDAGKSQEYFRQAFEGFKQKAESGDKAAQNSLGLCYQTGQGVTQNNQLAFEWFNKSAEQGYAPAQYNLGVCYQVGNGVEQDFSKCIDLIASSVQQDYAPALLTLGMFGMVSKNYDSAIICIRQAAEQGYAEAQCFLGVCYAEGKGVERDDKTALKYFREAAENGYAVGQCLLANCYANGKGIEQNDEIAVQWFRQAAEQGYSVAQYCLGVCYASGDGVGQDVNIALQWLHKAAEQDNVDALETLAFYYSEARNWTKAMVYEERAKEARTSLTDEDRMFDLFNDEDELEQNDDIEFDMDAANSSGIPD